MKSCIHIIRHGITDGVKRKLFYGWTDLPVIQEGVEEIDKLKGFDIYPKIKMEDTQFFTSGLLRTNQTLELIYPGAKYREIPNLKEINFGDWEMKTLSELEKFEGWNSWMSDESGEFSFPGGGESYKSFNDRIARGVDEVMKLHRYNEFAFRNNGKDIVSVVVCHGGVIASIMNKWFPDEKEFYFAWTPGSGRGYSVILEDGEPVSFTEIAEENPQFELPGVVSPDSQ